MKDLIKNILREQLGDEQPELSDKQRSKIWKMFDKIGIAKTLPHFEFFSETSANIVTEYFRGNMDPKRDLEVELIYDAEDIAKLFNKDMQHLVKNYLNHDFDWGGSECLDYDHNWMWDELSKENQKIILDSAIKDKIDFDHDHPGDRQERDLIEYIDEMFGSQIGCSFGDAQHDADINEIGKDIDSSIEDYFDRLNGKWSWEKGRWEGKIKISQLAQSNEFEDAVDYELEFSPNIDWDDVESKVMEFEMDNAGYSEGVLFDEKMYFNEDKHFRYGGAGDMDKDYMNELLQDRLENGY